MVEGIKKTNSYSSLYLRLWKMLLIFWARQVANGIFCVYNEIYVESKHINIY